MPCGCLINPVKRQTHLNGDDADTCELFVLVLPTTHTLEQPQRAGVAPPVLTNHVVAVSADGRSMNTRGCVGHLEIMVYNANQMLPVAVVTYEHETACSCSQNKARFKHPRLDLIIQDSI